MSEIVYFRYPMKNCQADSTIEGRRPTAPMLPRAYVCSREPSGAGWLAGPYRDARVVVKLKEPILKPSREKMTHTYAEVSSCPAVERV